MVFKRNISNNKMVIMVNILSGYLYALHANYCGLPPTEFLENSMNV